VNGVYQFPSASFTESFSGVEFCAQGTVVKRSVQRAIVFHRKRDHHVAFDFSRRCGMASFIRRIFCSALFVRAKSK